MSMKWAGGCRPDQRADVEREIRSLIEDEVAGRLDSLEANGIALPETETTVLAVLEQFGSPEEMATRYHAPRYLIGPTMFPIFQIVLGIVLAVTLFTNLFGLAVAAGTHTAAPLNETLLDLLASIIQAIGMLTLISRRSNAWAWVSRASPKRGTRAACRRSRTHSVSVW